MRAPWRNLPLHPRFLSVRLCCAIRHSAVLGVAVRGIKALKQIADECVAIKLTMETKARRL